MSGLAPTNRFPRSPHISAHLPAGIRHCRLQAAQSTDVERRAGPRRPRPALRSPAQRATTPHRFCARCRFQERRTFPAKAGVPTKRTTGLRDTERAMTQRNVANLRALLETWDVEAWKRGEDMGLLDPEVTYEDTTLPDHVGETYRGHAGVARATERWVEPYEGFAIELERIVGMGDRLVSVHRVRSAGAGHRQVLEARRGPLATSDVPRRQRSFVRASRTNGPRRPRPSESGGVAGSGVGVTDFETPLRAKPS